MNNATLALNVTRPVSHPAGSSAATKTADDAASSSSPSRFDAAMDAARADTRRAKDNGTDGTHAHDTSAASSARPPARAAKKSDDDTAKKDDDRKDDDTSVASTMLALIGVPPKLADAAGRLAGSMADAVGGTLGLAIGSLLPGAGDAEQAVAGLKDGAMNPFQTTPAAVTGDASAAPASPFAALLALQGADVATKDDAAPADPATASPMPMAHAPGMLAVDGPAVQVQATQAATAPQFAQELGEQIAWMGSGEVKEARIKLHPEELGSMDVRVNMDGNKVNVAIIAQHPAAVHAVQQTLSQLDTLLAHHGLSLGQAHVGQGSTGQGSDGNAGQGGQGGTGEASNETVALSSVSSVARGLVDEVA